MLNSTPEELTHDVRLYAALMLFRLGKLSSRGTLTTHQGDRGTS